MLVAMVSSCWSAQLVSNDIAASLIKALPLTVVIIVPFPGDLVL